MLKKDDRKENVSRFEATRCRFEHFGQQCRLLGDISPSNGDGAHFYCSFHIKVVGISKDLNTYKKFMDWREEFIEMYPEEIYGSPRYDDKGECEEIYVSQFHKYELNQLWEMMGNRS